MHIVFLNLNKNCMNKYISILLISTSLRSKAMAIDIDKKSIKMENFSTYSQYITNYDNLWIAYLVLEILTKNVKRYKIIFISEFMK